MAKLSWDNVGERLYETGIDRGVLYTVQEDNTYAKGEAWNGLSNITESPSGAEASPIYADNIKYLNLMSAEEFGITIEAYMYPDGFAECNGEKVAAPGVYLGQQNRKTFGLCYRSLIGNDLLGTDYGYKLHLVYGCNAAPSERAYSTVNDSPEAAAMSWEVKTTPVNVEGFKPTACITINSTEVDADKLATLEAILYGSESEEARLPMPDEIVTLLGKAA